MPKKLAFVVGAEAAPGREGAWIASPVEGWVPLRFADGTLVRLAPGSRARIASVNPDGARIVLERGSASATVVHRPKSRWTFDVGPFEVDVVGTRFDVSWDDQFLRIRLQEGTVRVSGPCLPSPRLISAGHDLQVSCGAARPESAELGAASGAPELPVAAAEPPRADAPDAGHAERKTRAPSRVGEPVPRAATRSVLRSDAWRALTASRRFADALELVEAAGFEDECARGTGADLLDLGDVARFAGKAARAREAYLAARAKIPAGGRTAYSLGILAFDQDHDFATAARWFDTYLREQPNGELRREAMGRLVEAWHLAGNEEFARAAAERYLKETGATGTQPDAAR